ncbi:unnamed protein product [Symbiodinium necroappetens]|uniref:Uncharacterized protein n=1 Tax=Symbiodinium necroappetens TaxID=1628268 RepID=A0A812S1V5_9DINO|nr:unnamed protein product [Symbiodinium necroappetens]
MDDHIGSKSYIVELRCEPLEPIDDNSENPTAPKEEESQVVNVDHDDDDDPPSPGGDDSPQEDDEGEEEQEEEEESGAPTVKSKKKRSKNKKQSWAQTIEEEDIAKEMDRCNLKSDEPPSGVYKTENVQVNFLWKTGPKLQISKVKSKCFALTVRKIRNDRGMRTTRR